MSWLISGFSSPQALVRAAALYDVCACRIRAGFAMRAATCLGWVVGLLFVGFMLVLWPHTRGALAEPVVARALVWLAVLAGGLAAWGAARDLGQKDEKEGISALAAERGFSLAQLEQARWAATMTSVARAMLGPTLLLSGSVLVMASSLQELRARLVFAAATLGYVGLVALLLGSLGRVAVWVAPPRGRSLFCLLVLGPELLHSVFPDLPSALAWIRAWAQGLAELGGRLS